MILVRWFYLVCLFFCIVDGLYSVCKGFKVVKEDVSYGCGKRNYFFIVVVYLVGDFVIIVDEDYLKMVK